MIPALLLPLLLLPSSPPQATTAGGSEEATTLAAELLARADEAEPAAVRRLAALRTPEALASLARFYDALGSLHMRRIALKAFATFDGVEACEPGARQELVDIATQSLESELRESAVDELARFGSGHEALAAIVASSAEDAVRERALRHHVGRARPEDHDWYRTIFAASSPSAEPQERKKEKDKKKDKEPTAAAGPVYTPALGELAYEGLAPVRTLAELEEDVRSKLAGVQRRALEELSARGEDRLEGAAEFVFERRDARPDVRLLAARLLLDRRGAKFADTLYKEATRSPMPFELLLGLADTLAALDVPALHAQAVKALGDGQPSIQRFHLRLTGGLPDPKVDKALLELSSSKHLDVALEAVRVMGQRANPSFVPRLEKLLGEKRPPRLQATVIEALARIRAEEPAWLATLSGYVASSDEDLRNAALTALGRTRDATYQPTLIAALEHPSWSTRLAAARGLVELRSLAGVGALCARIAREEGRLEVELGELLTRVTGQPFRSDGKQWQRWWEAEAASWKFPSESEIAALLRQRAEREERRVSRSFRGVAVDSRFFGLHIASHAVAFVVDVSGSMEEPLPGSTGKGGPTRMEAAKKELLACLDALEAGTHFNIVPFSDQANAWKEESVEATVQSFEDAREFLTGLGGLGGTNLFGGLERAFEDPGVDTIFLLSDGQPSVGRLTDPQEIREEVQLWLRARPVVIHTVSVGERFPLLEWLARDSGGQYRTYP